MSPADIYLETLGVRSKETQVQSLRRVLRVLGLDDTAEHASSFAWQSLSQERVEGIQVGLTDRYSPATAKLTLVALSRVLHTCWRLGLMDTQRTIRFQPDGSCRLVELSRLLETCRNLRDTWTGARDAAMLSVLFCACLRREEIVGVDVEDVSNGVIQADNRIVYLPPGAREAVELWVETRGIIENEPALFVLGRQGYQRKRLAEGDVLAILNRIALRARVRPFTPADLSQKRNTV